MLDSTFLHTNRKNLLQLMRLRLIAIFGQLSTILIAQFWLHISLPLREMFVVLAFLSAASCVSFFRYHLKREISDTSLFAELLLDVIALTIQIYLSGGISNPFISLFLVQVIIAAILLRPSYAWIIAVITTFCYVVLSFYYRELQNHHHHQGGDFLNMHLHGMLLSYVISALLLLIFITKISKNLKEGDQKIYTLQRQAMQKEQVVRMGILATNAAHELSTPLSTILVVINDWQKMSLAKDMAEDVNLIESQVIRCRKIISDILNSSGQNRFESANSDNIKKLFDNLIDDWRSSRQPENLIYNFVGNDRQVVFDNSILQSLFNIFDNALEASEKFISILVKADEKMLIIEVEDRGEGFDSKVLQELGNPNNTTKNSSGLGLFLTMNILKSVKGSLEVMNLEVGAKVTVKIPFQKL